MSDKPWRHLYNSTRWRKCRIIFLQKHPLCGYCEQQGIVTPATIVDHIKPHKGDEKLFFDESNWQGLCKTHHDSTKHAQERGHRALGAGLDGAPIDPNHPWNRSDDDRG